MENKFKLGDKVVHKSDKVDRNMTIRYVDDGEYSDFQRYICSWEYEKFGTMNNYACDWFLGFELELVS